jgi:hypothetical protein
MRTEVTEVLLPLDGDELMGGQRLVQPRIERPDGKGIAVEEDDDIVGLGLFVDQLRQRVEFLAVGAGQIFGMVESLPEIGVIDAVEHGKHPIRRSDVSTEVVQLRADPLRGTPMDGHDIDHRLVRPDRTGAR